MSEDIQFNSLTVTCGTEIALRDITMGIPEKTIFGIIGPANSGKTTLLKCINRTIDFVSNATVQGHVLIGGENVSRISNVYALRRKIGIVFPLPVGLPLSVYENVAYAPRRAGVYDRAELDALVEKCLRQAMLWGEVKERLHSLGTKLSGVSSAADSRAATEVVHRPAVTVETARDSDGRALLRLGRRGHGEN